MPTDALIRQSLARLILFTLAAIPVLVLLGLLHGCSTFDAGWQPVCRHHALTCAIMASEKGYDARVVSGQTATGEYHAQAKYRYREGYEWKWLSYDAGFCYVGTAELETVTGEDSPLSWLLRIGRPPARR